VLRLQTTTFYQGSNKLCVTLIGSALAYLGVPLYTAKLRLRVGGDRPVRTRRAIFADGSLMITVTSVKGCTARAARGLDLHPAGSRNLLVIEVDRVSWHTVALESSPLSGPGAPGYYGDCQAEETFSLADEHVGPVRGNTARSVVQSLLGRFCARDEMTVLRSRLVGVVGVQKAELQ
jgi:hypothetical protein